MTRRRVHTVRDHIDRGERACGACVRSVLVERPHASAEREADERARTRAQYAAELARALA